MQDEIATATNVAMITVDYSGTPVTSHSSCSVFCKKVRENSSLESICEKCDSRGGVEAARLKKPYIYLCHMGLVDFAIPIIINDIYMGAVMAGQIAVKDKNNLERIVAERNEVMTEQFGLQGDYIKLPKMNYDKIYALSNIISYLVNTFIKEILVKKSIQEPSYEDNSDNHENSRAKKLIMPALQYIEENYKKEINLDILSDLCQISGSYLSRLFKKAVGCNYAFYVNAVRISHAKVQLITTNLSISALALDLGYDDAGYFIKVFKKHEGITPNEYRNKNTDRPDIIEKLSCSC